MWRVVIPALLGLAGSAAFAADSGRFFANGAQVKTETNELEISVEGSLASDYVSRGITLSARQPSIGGHIEVKRDVFYFSAEVNSVKLSTSPAAELILSAGIRPTIGETVLDLGVSYFYYPGEILPAGTPNSNSWEGAFGVTHPLTKNLKFEGQLAYSPSVSNTGAWGAYAAAGVEVELPRPGSLKELAWFFSSGVGHWRLGTISPDLGGFALPSYTHWHAGLTFAYRKVLKLDLRYHDTSLSKEDCFVSTGDPTATPGGAVDPIRNPGGLRSSFCGAALVGKLSYEYPPDE